MNYSVITKGAIDLFAGLKSNVWPEYFLENLLGLKAETAALLPNIAFIGIIAYTVFAVLALCLKGRKKHKSLSGTAQKIADCLCILMVVMCLCLVPQFIAQGRLNAAEVHGQIAFSKEGAMVALEYLQAWFEPLFISVQLLIFAFPPLMTARRYLKTYKLWGLIWTVYDPLFGAVIVMAAILAMRHGSFMWYLAILPPLILNLLGQRGGVIRQ